MTVIYSLTMSLFLQLFWFVFVFWSDIFLLMVRIYPVPWYCLIYCYYHVSFQTIQTSKHKICAHMANFQLIVVLHHVLDSHSLWLKNSIKRNNAWKSLSLFSSLFLIFSFVSHLSMFLLLAFDTETISITTLLFLDKVQYFKLAFNFYTRSMITYAMYCTVLH